jgi:hypothetical protein
MNDFKEYLKTIKNKINYENSYIIYALIFFVIYYIFLDKALYIITKLLSLLYPGYKSYLSMSNDDEKIENRNKWLTYWIVYSSISTIESIFWLIINYIPFYYVLKLFLTVWLIYPEAYGSLIIYKTLIEPYLSLNKSKIDAQISNLESQLLNAKKKLIEYLSK